MKLHAFISGTPESLAGGLLPVTVVVIWVALAVISNQRHKRRNRPDQAAPFVETTPAERRHNIVAAASRMRLNLGTGWVPPSPGDGHSKNLVPGREGIVGYVDYDEDFHSPRDVDRRRVSPRGTPQVPLIHEPHENVVLVVVDANQLDLAGSPNDEVDKLTGIREAALTILENARQNNYAVGLLATRGRQPVYLRPGSPFEEIVEVVRRLQAGDKPNQSQELRRLAGEYGQRAKAVVVISHFDNDDTQALLRQLPDDTKKIAIQVIGELDRQFAGLPGIVDIEYADDQVVGFDTRKDAQCYREAAESKLDEASQRIKQGGVSYCRVHLDQPDPPGQLATAINQSSHD